MSDGTRFADYKNVINEDKKERFQVFSYSETTSEKNKILIKER